MSEEFDELFATIATRTGGVKPLLDSFFSFLKRKTDFYVTFDPIKDNQATMGFAVGSARKIVLDAFEQYPMKKYSHQLTAGSNIASTPPKAVSNAVSMVERNESMKVPRMIEDGTKQVPIGNGGLGPNYYWTQTLKDLTVYIDSAVGIRGRDVTCNISTTAINVSVKGESIVNGILEEPIKSSESVWTLNLTPGSCPQILLTLEKIRPTWWKHIIVGHQEIDTTKVDSSQHIEEYDEATQATIRKIMHEQRMKNAGNTSGSPVHPPEATEPTVGSEEWMEKILRQNPLPLSSSASTTADLN